MLCHDLSFSMGSLSSEGKEVREQNGVRFGSRRGILRAAGTVGLVSLAGCTAIESFRDFQEEVEDSGIMPVGDDAVGEDFD